MHRVLLFVLAGFLPLIVQADETTPSHKVLVELNAAETTGAACTLTFLVQNALGYAIEEMVIETVLFAPDGEVDRLTLFDFGSVPAGRQRVRQFAIDDAGCEGLGSVLFNGTERCSGDGLTPEACDAAIVATSRSAIEVIQ